MDVVVTGGGWAGSLMSIILAAQGRKVVLLEREKHPRFAIGESSTPLANLALETLCDRYGLGVIRPLARYGQWCRTYSEVRRGCKRGFSFFSHEAHEPFRASASHDTELVVAANTSDETADTHWLRADVDHFFIQEAGRAGVEVHEEITLEHVERGPPWSVVAVKDDVRIGFQAPYLLDAAGAAGILGAAAGTGTLDVRTHSRALFSHFTGVPLWTAAGGIDDSRYPCPVDRAALHHVLPDGWIWVLRFDHGVTSVGMMLGADTGGGAGASDIWTTRMQRYPGVERHLGPAQALRPLTLTPRLQRRWSCASGPDHAMLPHAAYFLDPWLSSGNAHSMTGIERVAHAFEAWPNHRAVAARLEQYDRLLQEDIDLLDLLIDGSYRSFGAFDLLAAYLMYYFSAAIFSETARRAGLATRDDGFLLSHDMEFKAKVQTAYDEVRALTARGRPSARETDVFQNRVWQDIEPYDVAGLRTPGRNHLHPYV